MASSLERIDNVRPSPSSQWRVCCTTRSPDSRRAIWRSASTYRPERGAAGGWLYTVARNAIVDRLRRTGPTADAELPELASSERGPAQRAEDSDVAFRVHRAFEELQPREREVIELAYWSGMSQSEVAEYLHLPLGTVKTRTRSGLARLASVLEGEL